MIRESAAAPGTGTTVTLSGAQTGYVSFASAFVTSQANVYYAITDGSMHEFQVGALTVGSPNTLARGTPLWTSTGGAGPYTRLNFTTAPTVYCTVPASRAPFFNASDALDLGGRRMTGLPAAASHVTGDEPARIDEVPFRWLSTTTIPSSVWGVVIALPSGYLRYRVDWADVTAAAAAPLYLRFATAADGTGAISGASDYTTTSLDMRPASAVSATLTASYVQISATASAWSFGHVEFGNYGGKPARSDALHTTSNGFTRYVSAAHCGVASTALSIHIGGQGQNLTAGRFRLSGSLD
jgi:hypothetical protein